MEQMYKDEKLRSDLIAAAPAQVAKFNWDKSATLLWESMMKCVDQ
jgi:hypothetical protein